MTTVDDLDLPAGVTPAPVALLLLGRGADPDSERGVDCPGELPAASDPTLVQRAGRRGPRWASGRSCSATTTSARRSSSSPT